MPYATKEKRKANDSRPENRKIATGRAKAWKEKHEQRFKENGRRSHLLRYHGLSLEDYNRMVEEQNGVCKVCGKPPRGKTSRSVKLHVDHCHETGIIRGLLCGTCNRAIGMLGDTVAKIEIVVAYLKG